MKTVNFHPEAEAEMITAAVYYEKQHADLGKRFLVTVQEVVNNIRVNPFLYQTVHLDVRRCLTKTFPAKTEADYIIPLLFLPELPV
jgi:toxin ParE1/3/4